jgi:single-strand selective monofunctional uracil DNA glycosylase
MAQHVPSARVDDPWKLPVVLPSAAVELVKISRRLSRAVSRLSFALPVTHVYNPLRYARGPHEAYLERFGQKRGRVVLLGMNPGPFGMAQTGVPFGEVGHVRDWMRIEGQVKRPAHEHPKRPVLGFACARSEVSGARLWGWAKSRYRTPRSFFARFFVINYCPLAFLEQTGRNRTPDKLPRAEREPLYAACDRALRESIEALAPSMVVGVGTFARKRAEQVLADAVPIGVMLHPSPASPVANRGWQARAEQDLAALGIES